MGPKPVATMMALVLCGHLLLASAAPALNLDIHGQTIFDQLMQLATFTDDPNPAVTRVVFTDQDLAARAYVKGLMREAGLDIREDTIGNIYGRLPGTEPDAPAVGTGSHCDAIPLAGAFDGTLGVIGGIAALRALKQAGFSPRRPLEVVMFTSEEPTRFGLSCSGSRAIAGALDPEYLASLRDVNGSDYLSAARRAGYGAVNTTTMIAGAARSPADLAAFVELHIEQGPELEAQGLDIGVVTAIAAPAALELEFRGDGGHAGAQLMPLRNDAGLAAAELALALETAVLATGAEDSVGTTGAWAVSPNAVNSVPRIATLGIDIRDIDAARRDGLVQSVLDSAARIAEKRKVRWSHRILSQDPPATSGQEVVQAVQKAVDELGYSSQRMVSRAYHDTLFMAQVSPTAMIFVPCRNGWSHRPDEYAAPEDIERGVRVLALTMAELAGTGSGEEARVEL